MQKGGKSCIADEVSRMKELTHEDTLDVLSACLDLLAAREGEIRDLYDRLQTYEPVPTADGRAIGAITPDVDEIGRRSSPGWPTAVAVCGTPLVGRSLMLLCPQTGLRIAGITNSGLEGLKLAEKHKPRFAFIDLDVTDIDGLVLVSRMKEIVPDATIIALAGGSQESTLVSAIIAGANEVIGKPIQARRLMNAIGRLVKKGKTRSSDLDRIPSSFDPSKGKQDRESWSVI